MKVMRILKQFFRDLDSKGRKRVTVMFVPHSQRKIRSLHVSHYAIVTTIASVLLIFLISFTLLTNRSMKENELSFLTQKRYELKYQLGVLKADVGGFLSRTGYRNDLKKLFSIAGYVNGDEPILAVGGVESDITESDDNADSMLSDEVLNMEAVINELKVSIEYLERLKKSLRARKAFLDSVPNIWPLPPLTGMVAKPYDDDDPYKERGLHFECLPATPIRSTAAGTVSSISYNTLDGRITLIVEHEYGFQTIYRGLTRVEVKEGKIVAKGDVLGSMGHGRVRKKFLYQIMIANTLVNPDEYISGKY